MEETVNNIRESITGKCFVEVGTKTHEDGEITYSAYVSCGDDDGIYVGYCKTLAELSLAVKLKLAKHYLVGGFEEVKKIVEVAA